MEILRVADAAAWRGWLALNHGREKEAWLALRKKSSGQGGVSYEEAVEEALCFGWIESAVRRVDGESYAARFSPRRPGSRWSESNEKRVRGLIAEGRMTAAGLAAYGGRGRDLASGSAAGPRR